MENNIENQLKKHFHNREIKPNPVLWNVLESKLDAQKHKKKIHIYKWLAYASIFVGILFATALFFERTKTVRGENFTTKEKPLPQTKNTKTQKTPAVLSNKELNRSVFRLHEQKSTDKTDKVKKTVLSNKNTVAKRVFLKNEAVKLARISSKKKKDLQPIQNIVKRENEVVKRQFKKHLKTLSDADLDALLASTLSTMNQKDTTVRKISIETNQVLSVLESEINLPFKNRIIKSLIAGVQAVDNHLKNN